MFLDTKLNTIATINFMMYRETVRSKRTNPSKEITAFMMSKITTGTLGNYNGAGFVLL